MAGGRKQVAIGFVRDRAVIAFAVIAAGILGPPGPALGVVPAPASDTPASDLTPEEEAQQIAEMGEPPPDTDSPSEEVPADPEETPEGLPGSTDDELDLDGEHDAPAAPAPQEEATPAPSPPELGTAPVPTPPAETGLHPDHVRSVEWWEHASLSNRIELAAAELSRSTGRSQGRRGLAGTLA